MELHASTRNALILFGAALALRVTDIFVLRLDERLGEIILSKSLGFLLVLVYLLWQKRRPAAIGLHARHGGAVLLIGAGVTSALFLIGLLTQYLLLAAHGARPELVVAAIDPKAGVNGGIGFGAWLVAGNFVNSFMEEGLFRGLMLRKFRIRLSFAAANLFQALLFAAWHLVWPVKQWWIGDTDLAGAAPGAVMLFSATLISGWVYGYMYQHTDSLWTPWVAHTIHNTALNLLHIRTSAGLDTDMFVLQAIVVVGLLPAIAAVRWVSVRLRLPMLQPWA